MMNKEERGAVVAVASKKAPFWLFLQRCCQGNLDFFSFPGRKEGKAQCVSKRHKIGDYHLIFNENMVFLGILTAKTLPRQLTLWSICPYIAHT